MVDKQHRAMVYRADLLWSFSTVPEDQHNRWADLLGFEEKQPIVQKSAKESKKELPDTDTQTVNQHQAGSVTIQTISQTSSYYRITDRQIDADKIKKAKEQPSLPVWLNKAEPTYFTETETRVPEIHRVTPQYPSLVSWSRLWPVLQKVLGCDLPGTRPDLTLLVKQVSEGRQIHRIPKTHRYTWSPNARILIDINDSNFLYRQDFIRLRQKLVIERGLEGLEIQYIYDQPGGTIIRDENDQEILEPWRSPGLDTPLLILSDLGLHSKSYRSLYPWLVFGQLLNLQGIRATVLMPVAERQLDHRLLRYFDCILWDANSRLKPLQDSVQSDDKSSEHSDRLNSLIGLMYPALRVELGLLRGIRQILPASLYDVGHEVEVWYHSAVNRSADEWGWQTESRGQYQSEFLKQFNLLTEQTQQHLINLIGYYHASLPDELYFEVMYQMLVLNLPLDDKVKTATLDFFSMLVKTYQQNPEAKSLDLWVKRFLSRHPTLRSEHITAFLVIKKIRSHQQNSTPIEWPEHISPEQILPFIGQELAAENLYLLRQKGMQLELISDKQAQDQQNDWGDQAVTLIKIRPLNKNIILRSLVANNHQQYSINLETDLPFLLSLPQGKHALKIAEHRITIEVLSTNAKPKWQYSLGIDSNAQFIETCNQDDKVYRWYWHPPEIDDSLKNDSVKDENRTEPPQGYTLPGFWYDPLPGDESRLTPDWADTANRDQYGLYAEISIAGVKLRFRWIPPGSFQMGSPENEKGRYDNEILHLVNFSEGFWLAETACTQALWQAVVGQNPSEFKAKDRPVETVSWHDVQKFLKTLNKQHSDVDLRLPTESEWEYACRAGTTSAFNFADELNLEKCNYRGTWEWNLEKDEWGKGALKKTAKVKTYPANAWGLYEMHGNVLEWCQDWYGAYPDQSVTVPKGSESGVFRVLRGGSWSNRGRFCRSAYRRSNWPVLASFSIGFRLARGHQSSQASSVAVQQPDESHAVAARGAQPGDGLRDADSKSDKKTEE